MPLVPLPLVVTLLLLLLLAHLLRTRQDGPPNPPFLVLIAGCAVQSTLAGLRWGYGIESVRLVQPVVAAALPALLAASFGGLAWEGRGWRAGWIHALAPLAVAILMGVRPHLVDTTVIAIYLGYAAMLLQLARSGPDGLSRAPLEGARPTWGALVVAACVLILSAGIDALVIVNLESGHDLRAATIVGVANLVGLVVLGGAASVAGRRQPPPEAPGERPGAAAVDEEDLSAVFATVDRLVRDERLFLDTGLTLGRLARRAGVPARRVSMAINRIRQQNVSQYINGYRIAEACRLLRETDKSVTSVMFDVGFETKSNFNREFRRATGVSPAEWRKTAHLTSSWGHQKKGSAPWAE